MHKEHPSRAEVELSILYRISHALAQQNDITPLLDEVLNIMANEMNMIRGTITLRDANTDLLIIEASHGLTAEEKKRGQYTLGEGITGIVAKTGKPAVIPDISKDSRFLNRTRSRKLGSIAFICVPIIYREQVIGTLSIDRHTTNHDELEKDLRFVKLVADLLAEGVARIREIKAEKNALEIENKLLREQLDDKYKPENIIGNCNSMRQIYKQISTVADSNATILIRGESGTGKELVARAIHFASLRKNAPFICVNCAALPENLIESELFGHERGAFTGAIQQRKGRFELANGGTLFLDEIGDISPATQVRLLRVLQEKTFERIGGTSTIKVDVRIIAATSRNLEKAMSEGKFREDLYYRLNVFPIALPPLRERRSDIILLADHFIQKYNAIYRKNVKRISTAAINMMMMYHWPGNVRELENCIERAVLTSTDDVIHAYLLPPSLQTSEQTKTPLIPEKGASLKVMVDSYMREIIIDALKKNKGNVSAAARELQTTNRIINYKIKQFGITPTHYKT